MLVIWIPCLLATLGQARIELVAPFVAKL